MNNAHFDEEAYKSLLPIPKTHIFMKKMVKIQAIDRQMRRQWMKINRQKLKKQINLTQNLIFNSNKKNLKIISSQDIDLSKEIGKFQNVQNNLKRQRIISNHKKNEQIFYRKKQKNRYPIPTNQPGNLSIQRYKTEEKKRVKSQENQPIKVNKLCSSLKLDTQLSDLNELRKCITPLKAANNSLKQQLKSSSSLYLPRMLLKRTKQKDRENQIINSQSQKELIKLEEKSQFHFQSLVGNRRDLLRKLKGTHVYYIMKKPPSIQDYQNIHYQ